MRELKNGAITLHWELVLLSDTEEDLISGIFKYLLREVAYRHHDGVFEALDRDAAIDHCVYVLGIPRTFLHKNLGVPKHIGNLS